MAFALFVRNSILASCVFGMLASSAMTAEPKAGDPYASETKEQRDARMAWWRDARFGMFIHWGVYSVPAGTWDGKKIDGIGEWIMNQGKIPVKDYEKFPSQFNPVKFNADEWVAAAKKAGMKYIVITSKHHDGFAMFHSKTNPYNIYDATPFKRDPLKELAEACKKQGIKLGFYYSQCQDWHYPGGEACPKHWDPAQDGDFDKYIDNLAVPQVKEILSNYGPIAVLWWDTPTGAMTPERSAKLAEVLKLQPGIIHNNRLGGGFQGDTETPEQFIPPTGYPGRDWETCMTLNDTWGYKSYDDNWKSTEVLLQNLIDIASKGGNYLLNVGPTSEGVIPQPSLDRLAEVGRWMDVNGESIYGTTASPFKKLVWGRCTQKPGKLYLHVFDWPKGELVVGGLKNKVNKAYLLADKTKKSLPVTATAESVSIKTPAEAPDKIASVVVLEIEGVPEVIDLPIGQSNDGSLTLAAADANLHGKTLVSQITNNRPNLGAWTDQNDWAEWSFEITKPGKFDVNVIFACPASDAGSEYELSAADQKLSGKVADTGDWGNFNSAKLGTITISKAGRYTLSVKPTSKPHGAVMNLESITLKPATP